MKRIAGLSVWAFLGLAAAAGHQRTEHTVLAAAFFTFLTHVLAHKTSDEAKEALAGFEDRANHDLEFALVAAYRAALQRARQSKIFKAPDLAVWFEEWEKLLASVRAPEEASKLFDPFDRVDPAARGLLEKARRRPGGRAPEEDPSQRLPRQVA